jgi:cold shock CspA family protein
VIRGTLKKWDDDKGFGFIRREDEGTDVFIHVSALKNLSRRPRAGDIVVFRIVTEAGKTRAADAEIEGMRPVDDNPGTWWTLEPIEQQRAEPRENAARVQKDGIRVKPRRRRERPGLLARITPVVVLTALVAAGSKVADLLRDMPAQAKPPQILPAATPEPPRFTCEGKTRCSQMNSCEEAMFYLENCPGTKMDGDADGIPCEDQHCRQ